MAKRKLKSITNGGKVATIYRDSEWNEFVVKMKGAPKADYFTDDKSDAEGTAKKMVGLAGFGSPVEEHREVAKYHVREVKRLVGRLRAQMKSPPDCERAAGLALALAQHSGIYHQEKVHSNLPRTTYGGRGVRALLDKFVKACVVKPRSAAAQRKIGKVWR